MNEEKKKSKKKILTYYLILGACILLIAAITVTVIFAVNNSKNNLSIDKGNTQTDNNDGNGDQNKPGDDQKPGNDDQNKPDDGSSQTSTKYEFIVPIETVDVINGYTFYKNNTLNYYHFHTGLDFAAPKGTEVFACLDGTVESITTGDLLDGTLITLAHENGTKSTYRFVEAKEGLEVGSKVAKGDVIGTVAEANGSEYKDGAHLHFEILENGEATDPEKYLDIDAK